tara:strand:- start:172 stop:855 length:684 start_codon:yes stop_codon:yes gene_type:complete
MNRAPEQPTDPIRWCMALPLAFWVLVLWNIAIPSQPYFDEVHYLPAAKDLLVLGEFSNREHPLLGKELIALGIALFGDNPWGWRIMSSISGALALFAIMRAVWFATCSRYTTIAAGLLVASGFHLFVHSRIAMLDIFMVCALAVAFWQLAAAMREPETGRRRLIGAGIALGLAMLLRHSLGSETEAGRIERAVAKVVASDTRGADLGGTASTSEIGDAVLRALTALA